MSGTRAASDAVVPDELLAAPVETEGPWAAVRAIRTGSRKLRREGRVPHLVFLVGISARSPGAETGRSTVLLAGLRHGRSRSPAVMVGSAPGG
jgi:hypothetical protein